MQNFFYGWYFKCQSDTQTLSIIPAVFQSGGKYTCAIQFVTEEGTFTATLPACTFWRSTKGSNVLKQIRGKEWQEIRIGENIFCERGIKLAVDTQGLSVEGKLYFQELTPLKYDIMGPFVLVPFMECRHSVYSMKHMVTGNIFLNGQKFSFQNAPGYWEGDRGRSFPKEYLWTQCFFDGGSIMLSVADIPLCGSHFTGVIGVVLWQGCEYRFATYLGARVTWLQNGVVRIVQGDMNLEVRLLEKGFLKKQMDCCTGKALQAPVLGEMTRIIHENVVCRARYLFKKGDEIYLNFETDKASFEYEYKK